MSKGEQKTLSLDDFLSMVEDEEVGLVKTLQYMSEKGGMDVLEFDEDEDEQYATVEKLYEAYIEYTEMVDTL